MVFCSFFHRLTWERKKVEERYEKKVEEEKGSSICCPMHRLLIPKTYKEVVRLDRAQVLLALRDGDGLGSLCLLNVVRLVIVNVSPGGVRVTAIVVGLRLCARVLVRPWLQVGGIGA